jgi:hypothetical protein
MNAVLSAMQSQETAMYLAFKHSHLLMAILSMLLTCIWAIIAWHGAREYSAGLMGKTRAIYIAHRAVAGLAGLTGIGVTLAGPWSTMLFPYVGLLAFLVHGMAATISRKTFVGQQYARKRKLSLLVQVIALLLSAYVMMVKPVCLLAWPW